MKITISRHIDRALLIKLMNNDASITGRQLVTFEFDAETNDAVCLLLDCQRSERESNNEETQQ